MVFLEVEKHMAVIKNFNQKKFINMFLVKVEFGLMVMILLKITFY